MNYNSHKDQQLISEAYLKVKQKNDVVVEGIFQTGDPSTWAPAAAAAGAIGAYKGAKGLYSWATGWTKDNKEIYNQIMASLKEDYPDFKRTPPELKTILDFLYDQNYLTPVVYNKIYKSIKVNPATTLKELGLDIYKLFKQVAIERGKKLSIGKRRADEIKQLLYPRTSTNTPRPDPAPGPTPPDNSEYADNY